MYILTLSSHLLFSQTIWYNSSFAWNCFIFTPLSSTLQRHKRLTFLWFLRFYASQYQRWRGGWGRSAQLAECGWGGEQAQFYLDLYMPSTSGNPFHKVFDRKIAAQIVGVQTVQLGVCGGVPNAIFTWCIYALYKWEHFSGSIRPKSQFTKINFFWNATSGEAFITKCWPMCVLKGRYG